MTKTAALFTLALAACAFALPARTFAPAPLPDPLSELTSSLVAATHKADSSPPFAEVPLFFVREDSVSRFGTFPAFRAGAGDRAVHLDPLGATFAVADNDPSAGAVIRMTPRDSILVPPEGIALLDAKLRRFHGDANGAKTVEQTAFAAVLYEGLWHGVDLIFRASRDAIKYELHVDAGIDPGAIEFTLEGATALVIDQDGSLLANTPAGPWRDARPVAWQLDGETKIPVAAKWRLGDEPLTFGFALEEIDRELPLVIDPAVPVSFGFLGGAGEAFSGSSSEADEGITDVAVGPDGCVYVVGWTWSTESSFPTAVGPFVEARGARDAFVAKLAPTGSRLLYCGFLGGANRDEALSVAVEPGGSVYVGGVTYSDETTFPVRTGPSLTYSGAGDGFLARIDRSGELLEFCGYVGTPGFEQVRAVATYENSGRVFFTGTASSGELPTVVGPDLQYNGSQDAFVGRLEVSGAGYEYLGYLGGRFDETGADIAVDSEGRAYVCGTTFSSEDSFPVAVGPDLTYNHPIPGFTAEAYVARVSPGGTALEYCGYIGGASFDAARAIAVDRFGGAVTTGTTLSDETTFPVLRGPFLEYAGGAGVVGDAFVARVRPDGAGLVFCGYLGGALPDSGESVAVDPTTGDAWVAGATYSDDFPVNDAGPGTDIGGNADLVLARISPDGTLLASGRVGGPNDDIASAIAHDGAGSVIVGGTTRSREDALPVAGGPDVTFNGGHPDQSAPADGFVARYVLDGAPVTVSIVTETTELRAGDILRFDVTVRNHTDRRRPIAGYLEALRPDGSAYLGNPLLGPALTEIPAHAERTRSIELRIPASVPPSGPFTLRAVIGDAPWLPASIASVDITIVP